MSEAEHQRDLRDLERLINQGFSDVQEDISELSIKFASANTQVETNKREINILRGENRLVGVISVVVGGIATYVGIK